MTDWAERLDGFRWPVAVSRAMPTPPEAIWAVLSTPGHLESCHPFCARNPVTAWPGATARDEVHYLNGWILERRFLRWIEGVGYDLEIGRIGGRTSYVRWRLATVRDGSCALAITVYPHVLQELPRAVRWLPHRLRVRPLLESYLSSVVRGVEWFATRGEPVTPNQFGTHPWFS